MFGIGKLKCVIVIEWWRQEGYQRLNLKPVKLVATAGQQNLIDSKSHW